MNSRLDILQYILNVRVTCCSGHDYRNDGDDDIDYDADDYDHHTAAGDPLTYGYLYYCTVPTTGVSWL